MPLCQLPRAPSEVDDSILAASLGSKDTIEPSPAIRFDLSVETTVDFEVGSGTKLLGDEVRSAGPHALADVVP